MVQKYIARVVLFFILFTQSQAWVLYVNAAESLEWERNQAVSTLDAVDSVLDTAITKIDKKLKSKKTKQRLGKKQVEIKEYLEEVKKEIKKTKSKKEIKLLTQKAKKKLVLKVVSWVSNYKNIEEWIDKKLKTKQKKKALKALQKSLKNKGSYNLIIKTKLSKKNFLKKYKTFDSALDLKLLYKKGKNKYFELSISEDSILREELLDGIESGEFPESFLWVDVIKPEIFSIQEISLEWEDISQTWWVEKYNLFRQFETVSLWEKIQVWIIDTWIDYNHTDLKDNVVSWYDFINDDNDAFDDQWHGTHVAGTVWASINGEGIIWMNPYVELVPLKICDSDGFCPSYAITRAVSYAMEQNIDVINMSLWGRWNPNDSVICDAIQFYTQNWGVAIVAAWNSNIDTSEFVPGGCLESITVAAVDSSLQRASFSNYGSDVDIAAPWVGIYSTYPGNLYRSMNGTSMAAPHIAGLVSVMKSLKPELGKDEIKQLLKINSTNISTDQLVAWFVDTVQLLSSLDAVTIDESTDVVVGEGTEVVSIDPVGSTSPEDISILESVANIDFSEEYEEIPTPSYLSLDGILQTEVQSTEEDFIPVPEIIYNKNPEIKMDFPLQINSLEVDNEVSPLDQVIDITGFEISQTQEDNSWYPYKEWENQILKIEEVIDEWPSQEVINTWMFTSIPELEKGENIEINSTNNERISFEEKIEKWTLDEIIKSNSGAIPQTVEIEIWDIWKGDIQNKREWKKAPYHRVKKSLKEPIFDMWEMVLPDEGSGSGITNEDNWVSIQRSYSCSIFKWQQCKLTINDAGRHSIEPIWDSVASVFTKRDYVYFTWIKPGTTTYNFIRYGSIFNTVTVTVKDIPEPIDLYCTVKSGGTCNFSLPEAISYAPSAINSEYTIDYEFRYNFLTVDTRSVWKTSFTVNTWNIHLATIHLDITPNVPEYECTIIEWWLCKVNVRYAYALQFIETVWGLTNINVNNEDVYITWLKWWEEYIYFMWPGYKDYRAGIKVKVIAVSDIELQTTNCKLWEVWNECVVSLISANKFTYTTSTGWIVNVSADSGKIYISSQAVWETDVYVKYNGSLVWVINILVQTNARAYNCRTNLWRECSFYLPKGARQYTYTVSTPWIVDLELWWPELRTFYVRPQKAWSVVIYAKHQWGYVAQIYATFTEIKEYNCDIEEWSYCSLLGLPEYYDYEVIKDDIRTWRFRIDSKNYWDPKYLEVAIWPDTVTWIRSWTVDLYIDRAAALWIHTLAIMHVNITEQSYQKQSFCETKVNGRCDIGLRNIWTDKYSIMVSKPGMLRIEAKRDYMVMFAEQEWEVEVIIKNNETWLIAHKGTVTIEGEYIITVPRIATTLSEKTFNLSVWESAELEIINGNTNNKYTVIKRYPNISVSYVWTNKYNITVLNGNYTNNTIQLIDTDKEYENATVNIIIETADTWWGWDTGWGTWDLPLSFKNLSYEPVTELWIWIMNFDITWSPTEVWIQYLTSDNSIARQQLEINPDGIYSLVIDKNDTLDSGAAYENFMPYYVDAENTSYYYADDNYLSFGSEAWKWEVIWVWVQESNWVKINADNAEIIFERFKVKIDKIVEVLKADESKQGNIPVVLEKIVVLKEKHSSNTLVIQILEYLESGLKGVIGIVDWPEWEVDEFIKSLLEDTGISITVTWLNINVLDTYRCKLNNSSKEYYKPEHAQCVTEQYNAWKCNTWYTEVWWYSCVNEEYYWVRSAKLEKINIFQETIDTSITKISMSLSSKSILEKYDITSKLIAKIIWIQKQVDTQYSSSKEKVWLINDILDYYVWKLDILFLAYEVELNKYKASLETALLKWQYEQAQAETESQTSKWNLDWYEQSVTDFLEEFTELLSLAEFWELLLWIKNFVYNLDEELENIAVQLWELYELYQNREEIFAWLDDYKKAYYTSYLETTVWLAAIPIKLGKFSKVKKWGDSSTLAEIKEIKKKQDEESTQSGTPVTVLNAWAKVEGRIDHVMDFELKSDWTYKWLHSLNELDVSQYVRDVDTNKFPNTVNAPYEAKVSIKDWNGWIIEKWNNGWISSIFPDGWSREKIIEEVTHAIENNKGKDTSPLAGSNEYIGFSKDNTIQINFYLGSDDSIISYFPKINN